MLTNSPNIFARPDEWMSQDFATQWDDTNRTPKQSRSLHMKILIEAILKYYKQGTYMIDCGIGSGLVEESLFSRRRDVKVIGIDCSEAMLSLCRKRLSPYRDQCVFMKQPLEKLSRKNLDTFAVSVVIAVQTVHHLKNEAKRHMFHEIRSILDGGGVFLLVDRFSMNTGILFGAYEAAWDVVNKCVWRTDPAPFSQYLSNVKAKNDWTNEVPEQLALLSESGFEAACVDLTIDRAFLAAVPRVTH